MEAIVEGMTFLLVHVHAEVRLCLAEETSAGSHRYFRNFWYFLILVERTLGCNYR